MQIQNYDWENISSSGNGQLEVSNLKLERQAPITLEAEFWKPNEFKPGLIHDMRFRSFWIDELKASQWVITVLDEGYAMPLKEWPDEYEERNNKSARDNMQIVRQIMAEMIQLQVVTVVKTKPRVVSPLGLVSKRQEDGSMKHRLVYDASRHLNKYLQVPHVRLNHLDKALEITQKGDLQTIFDLKSAYYHIGIQASQQCLLGASFQNSDGSVVYVQYTVLPFGIASAVHVITKLWKPISQYLNAKGIRNTIYIDDGRVLARTQEEAEKARKFTYEVVTKAGWAIETAKSDGFQESGRRKNYLGFLIDTDKMEVEATPKKIQKVARLTKEALKMSSIPIKRLASLMGNIIALEPSHGMLARVTTRSGYVAIAEHTEEFGWRGSTHKSPSMTAELEFFLAHLESRNGTPIKNKQLEYRLETIIPRPVAKSHTLANHIPGDQVIVSDSSEFKAFVYNLSQGGKTEFIGFFDDHQKQMSSGARELLAVCQTLQHWHTQGQMFNKNLYWATDSENVVHFLKKGSRKPDIQNIVFKIVVLLSDMKTSIEPIHLLREDPRIQIADEGSKSLDTDNWSVDIYTINELREQFVLDIDLFADSRNKVCDTFCSLYYEEGSAAVDAFTIEWSQQGFLWICPPVSELIRVWQRLADMQKVEHKAHKVQGLILLPIWKTANFYPLFFDDQMRPHHPFQIIKVWRPFILQHEDAKATALFGQVNFEFAALYFTF